VFHPENQRQIDAAIHDLLIHQWDPIGVNCYPEAQDEYDLYIGEIHGLLRAGTDRVSLVNHLRIIETERMGLSERDDLGREAVAEALLGLVVSRVSL
jgi:hypothetical protein